MTTTALRPTRPRPNLLFNLLGVLLIVVGTGMTIVGFLFAVRVITEFDVLQGDGPPVETADGMAMAFWGVIVLTIGRYFWRGARKRGLRDRTGRLLIIASYVLLGIGLDRGVHAAVGMWDTAKVDGGQSAAIGAIVALALWAVPASILSSIGFKLANEKALATAEAKADL
jgi:hypothetical protein